MAFSVTACEGWFTSSEAVAPVYVRLVTASATVQYVINQGIASGTVKTGEC